MLYLHFSPPILCWKDAPSSLLYPVVSSRSRGQFLTYKVIMKRNTLNFGRMCLQLTDGFANPIFHISLGLEEV